MFKIGDIAVYPNQGIGKIVGIEEKVIEGKVIQSYILKLLDSEVSLYIPLEAAKKVGLRPILSKEEAERIYQILSEEEIKLSNENWNKRYKEYMEKLKKGDIFVLAQLLRELAEVSKKKLLSFGERKIFERAKEFLVKELALCEGCSEQEMETKIKNLLKIKV